MKNNFNTKKYEIITKEKTGPAIYNFVLSGQLNFSPGQFIQAGIPHIGEATFAPCSDPDQKNSFELCVRGCGSTTDAITKLLPEDFLNIRGPYGNGWPIEKLKKKDIILVAGGMGLIPLRPLIFKLLKNKRSFNKISLFGGFRTKEHVLFEADLVKWKKSIDINIYLEQLTNDSFYNHGLITEPLEKMKINTKKSIALICGPEVMVPFVTKALSERGLPDDQIYLSYERRMECGIGICQHCSIGKYLVCKDGPVFRYDQIKEELGK